MQRAIFRRFALILAASWLLASQAFAMEARLQPGSRLWLEGDSTLHPFKSEARTIGFVLSSKNARALGEVVRGDKPATLTVTIPVSELKSEHKGLDKNLSKALNADRYPDIVFVMKHYRVENDTVYAAGDLSLAGVTNEETLTAKLTWKDGRAVLDGQQPLRMTDFGVTPPSMMLGTVKTSDNIVVKFHLEIEAGK